MSTDTIPDTFPSQVSANTSKVTMCGNSYTQASQSFAFDPQSEKSRPPATAVVAPRIYAILREMAPLPFNTLFVNLFTGAGVAFEDYDWCTPFLNFYNNVVDAKSPAQLVKQQTWSGAMNVDLWSVTNRALFADLREAMMQIMTVNLTHQAIADLVNHYDQALANDANLKWYDYQCNKTARLHGTDFTGITLRDYPNVRETRTVQSVGSITLFNKETGEKENANAVQACPNYINYDFDRNPGVVLPFSGASTLSSDANLSPSFKLTETARSSISGNLNSSVTTNEEYVIRPMGLITLVARFLAFYWRYGFLPNKILYTRTEVRNRHMYWVIGEREKTASAGAHTLVITQGVTLASNSVNSWLLQAACMQQAIGGDFIVIAPNVKVSNYNSGTGSTHIEDVLQFANHMFASMHAYQMHEMYVLAMATEFHKWITVNAHTAEAGVMRNLFTQLTFGGNAMVLNHAANGTHNHWGLDRHADKYCIFNLMRMYVTISFGALVYADCGYLYKGPNRVGLTPIELKFLTTRFSADMFSNAFGKVLGLDDKTTFAAVSSFLSTYNSNMSEVSASIKFNVQVAMHSYVNDVKDHCDEYENVKTLDELAPLKRFIRTRLALSGLINCPEIRLLYRYCCKGGDIVDGFDMPYATDPAQNSADTNNFCAWPFLTFTMMLMHIVTALPMSRIYQLVRFSCMIHKQFADSLEAIKVTIDSVDNFVRADDATGLDFSVEKNKKVILPNYALYDAPKTVAEGTTEKPYFDLTAFHATGASMRGPLTFFKDYVQPPEPVASLASGMDAYEQIRAAVTYVSAQAYLRALRTFFPHCAEMRPDAIETFRSMFASFNGRVYTDRHLLGDRHTVFPFCTLEPTSIFPPAVFNPTTAQTIRSFASHKNPGAMAFTGKCITPTGLVDINNEMLSGSFYNYAGVISPRCNAFAVYSRMSVKNGLFDILVSDASNEYHFCPEENIPRTGRDVRNKFVSVGDLTHAPDNTGTYMPFEGMFGAGHGVMGVSMSHPLRKNHFSDDLSKYAMLIQYGPYQDILTAEKISVVTYRNKNPLTKKKFQDHFEYQKYYREWLRVNDPNRHRQLYRARFDDGDENNDVLLRNTPMRTFYFERRLRGTAAFTSQYLSTVNYSARNTAFLTSYYADSKIDKLFHKQENVTTSGTLDSSSSTGSPEPENLNATGNTKNRDVGNDKTRPRQIGDVSHIANPYDNTIPDPSQQTAHQYIIKSNQELEQHDNQQLPSDTSHPQDEKRQYTFDDNDD